MQRILWKRILNLTWWYREDFLEKVMHELNLENWILLSKYCVCVLSCLVMSDSLWSPGLQPARLLCPWGFSRHKYWSALPCPPPGDFSQPKDQTRVSHIAGRFFIDWATREALPWNNSQVHLTVSLVPSSPLLTKFQLCPSSPFLPRIYQISADYCD